MQNEGSVALLQKVRKKMHQHPPAHADLKKKYRNSIFNEHGKG